MRGAPRSKLARSGTLLSRALGFETQGTNGLGMYAVEACLKQYLRDAPRASERAGYTGLSGLPCARASLFQTHPSHRVFVNTLPFWTLRWLFAFPSMLQDASSSFELTSG